MSSYISSPSKQALIDTLNKIFATSGGIVKDITDEQMHGLIEKCNAFINHNRSANSPPPPPPPPPPLPFSGTPFAFNGLNKSMGDALTSQQANLKKITKNEKITEAKKLPHAMKRSESQDLLTQELEKAIKRRVPNAEEKADKNERINGINSEIQDPSALSIKDRFKLWSKG